MEGAYAKHADKQSFFVRVRSLNFFFRRFAGVLQTHERPPFIFPLTNLYMEMARQVFFRSLRLADLLSQSDLLRLVRRNRRPASVCCMSVRRRPGSSLSISVSPSLSAGDPVSLFSLAYFCSHADSARYHLLVTLLSCCSFNWFCACAFPLSHLLSSLSLPLCLSGSLLHLLFHYLLPFLVCYYRGSAFSSLTRFIHTG